MSSDKVLISLVKSVRNKDVDPISPFIDKYLLQRAKSSNRLSTHTVPVTPRYRPPGRLSPSGVGGCMRQAAFSFLGVKRKGGYFNPDGELIMEQGTWIHHKWAAIFLDMEQVLGADVFKVLCIEEDISIPELFIAGTLDFRLWIIGFGEVVVDIKSINNQQFYSLILNNSAKEGHKEQCVTYVKAKSLRRGIVYYDNKDNQQRKAFVINHNDKSWEFAKYWYTQTSEFLKNKQMPPMHKECTEGSWMQKGCPFQHLCYSNYSKTSIQKYMYSGKADAETLYQESFKEP